jgi:hypothetical protein
MNDRLREAFVCEITGRFDDVEFVCLCDEKAITPGLHDRSALSDHGQIGLELTDAAFTQHARIEG